MKIAIVNDLRMAVEVLRRIVIRIPHAQVVWTAANGAEAVEQASVQLPDLILMDLIMPVMNGAEATRLIMQQTPCPILIVTASVDTNSSLVYEALGHGALDATRTPELGQDGSFSGADELVRKINNIAKLQQEPKNSPFTDFPEDRPLTPATESRPFASGSIVVIGASTGGPQALAEILSTLPVKFQTPIVIIQHVDQEFAPGLASWLESRTHLSVRIAEPGARPQNGTVLLAGKNDHLILSSAGTLHYTPEPTELSYRPSVDVFFQSVARHFKGNGCAILLTGMGRDGGKGLLALRNKGFHTIAQDAASSVVFGMPKYAAELNAAAQILPLNKISNAIVQLIDRT